LLILLWVKDELSYDRFHENGKDIYRINIGVWVFVLSGMLAAGIAVLTVSFQAFKAARANPIDSLRY
jgi:ABC-type antimicrobial peptide transport system permease subunit